MTGFTLPTSRRITQAWGAEFDDWDGDGIVDYPGGFYNSIGWDGHNGIDYGCGLGDPIYAVADGVVTWAAWAGNHWLLSGGGNAVLIEHAEYGVQTEYLHLSRFAVTTGQTVTKDQVIGYAGKTGAATGYHLHLGMLPLKGINLNNRVRGRIDPTPWLYGNLNPDYAGSAAITPQGTITPASEEDDDMATPEQIWKHRLPLGGETFEAGDILVYARTNAEGAKNNAETAAVKSAAALKAAEAAPATAVQILLATKLPDPSGSGREYTVAEYLTYGWWYAMQAKDLPQAPPIDPAALTAAIEVSAAAVAAQLQVTVKEPQ